MPSPTMAMGLLGNFPGGADPPATDQGATTPPVRSPTSLSLQEILTAGAGGRGVQGGVSGHKVPMEEGGRTAGEGGRNGDETGWLCGEAETGGRTTVARRRTTAEKECGRRGHKQVSSNGDGGERRDIGDEQKESNNASKGWSGKSAEDLEGSETEEER